MFKQSVEGCKPPDQWKIARVSAAFKKGREEDRTCYRPLSMLSITSKLMESCVASNITNHVVMQNLLDNRQWAYRKEKSTEQLLIHLTERWREAVKRKLFVGILLVDFTKAFDTVSHNILPQKLNDLGIRGDIYVVKELPYRTKTIRQNQRIRLRYTHYSSMECLKGRSSDPRYSPSSQTTSQNHYALWKLICMQTTQQYTVSQKRWIC